MPTSGWIILWALLILGALVFYALIGLTLFRKAQAVLAQAGETLDAVGEFGAALDAAEEPAFDTGVAVAATDAQKAGWRHQRRVNLIRRRKRRLSRRRRTLTRWRNAPVSPPWV